MTVDHAERNRKERLKRICKEEKPKKVEVEVKAEAKPKKKAHAKKKAKS